jgi:hypothetical protein
VSEDRKGLLQFVEGRVAKKPFIVPIPGTRPIPHMQENLGATRVKLSAADMAGLETGFSSIGVFGDRAPANLKTFHDIGTSIGATSKGTHGKTPLPKKILYIKTQKMKSIITSFVFLLLPTITFAQKKKGKTSNND